MVNLELKIQLTLANSTRCLNSSTHLRNVDDVVVAVVLPGLLLLLLLLGLACALKQNNKKAELIFRSKREQ